MAERVEGLIGCKRGSGDYGTDKKAAGRSFEKVFHSMSPEPRGFGDPLSTVSTGICTGYCGSGDESLWSRVTSECSTALYRSPILAVYYDICH